MKTKKLLAAFLSTTLAGSILLSAPALADAASFCTLPLNENSSCTYYTDISDDPEAVAAGHGQAMTNMLMSGFVVRYTGETGESLSLGNKTLYFEGEAYSEQISNGNKYDALRIQPYDAYMTDVHYRNLSYMPEPEVAVQFTETLSGDTQDLFIVKSGLLSANQTSAEANEALYALLRQDDRFTVLSAAFVAVTRCNDGYWLRLDCPNEADRLAVAEELRQLGTEPKTYSDSSVINVERLLPLAETLEICKTLEEDSRVSEVSLAYYYFDDTMDMTDTGTLFFALPGTGDLNTSGALELADAILLARAVGGTYQLSAEGRAEADLNADGEINSADLTALLERLSG